VHPGDISVGAELRHRFAHGEAPRNPRIDGSAPVLIAEQRVEVGRAGAAGCLASSAGTAGAAIRAAAATAQA